MTASRVTADQELAGRLLAAIEAELPAATELRHQIHREPDLGGHEERTATRIAEALGDPGAPWVTQGRLVRITGGAGSGGGRGPDEMHVAVRTELDALPLTEETGAPWASVNGAMHACGHDVHMAGLVAFGRALRAVGGPRPVLAVLQPREEVSPSGALDVVSSAELAAVPVGAFVAVHMHASLRPGTIAAQGGPVNASSDDLTISIEGRPAHAAYPHMGRDPIVAAAGTIMALQHLVSRRIDPMHPSVVTIGKVQAGAVGNAIPGSAVLTGSIRAFDEADRDLLHATVTETAELTARSYGCEATVNIVRGEPVLRNDPRLAAATAAWLTRVGLDPGGDMRSCGADDFSYYNAKYPSLMCFAGTGEDVVPGLHHPAFLPPDEAIFDVARAMLAGYLGACDLLAGP
jgi:amidohydrolase